MQIPPEELDEEDDEEIDPDEIYEEAIPSKEYIIPEQSIWQRILNMFK